jgi:hypothetical protein
MPSSLDDLVRAWRERADPFRSQDKLTVHTSALGTQSVKAIDILFPDSMMPELVEEARRWKEVKRLEAALKSSE